MMPPLYQTTGSTAPSPVYYTTGATTNIITYITPYQAQAYYAAMQAQAQAQAQNTWYEADMRQIAARNQQNLLRMARQQARVAARRNDDEARHLLDAQNKARELLLKHLSEEQRESFLAQKAFIVIGRSGKRYRVRDQGCSANIDELHEDGVRVIQRLCAHASPSVFPQGDQLLTQKLMLECAEEDFLRIANRHAAAVA